MTSIAVILEEIKLFFFVDGYRSTCTVPACNVHPSLVRGRPNYMTVQAYCYIRGRRPTKASVSSKGKIKLHDRTVKYEANEINIFIGRGRGGGILKPNRINLNFLTFAVAEKLAQGVGGGNQAYFDMVHVLLA